MARVPASFAGQRARVLIKSKGYPNGRAAVYVADFRYFDIEKQEIVLEDFKGEDTALSRLKRSFVAAQTGTDVRITRAEGGRWR